ncbi:VapE family protein [Labilibaculum sp. K2S]|uniref:VapE domain-containing protein n=1 Tax=Labilibaculum sp. K2S TaxID=3056386 RepID=UPI0025A3685B|nr:VapE domain-containing protein [Labilibaculum sp. K2S]MDM8161422.1 VapE family protein [Labilibaculum sp. K2S]
MTTENTEKVSEIAPKKTIANKFSLTEEYLNERYLLRNNIISLDIEIRKKDASKWRILCENSLYIELQKEGINISIANLLALLKSDYVPDYNPFESYFSNLPEWDGIDHIGNLASYVHTKDQNSFELHFRKWMVRVIKTAIDSRFFNKQALIFVHDKQNSGKSTFCRFLCPPTLGGYISENISIDKDSRIALATNILINLDELATLSRRDINSLKALFSKEKINDRLPYERKASVIPRRCSFIGSTNEMEFLMDETGSVRWLCFEIEKIDWEYSKKIDIDLVYAQAYHLVKTKFDCNLSLDEINENERRNQAFQILSEERQLIQKHFTHNESEEADSFRTATDIKTKLSQMLNINYLNVVKIGKALKQIDIPKKKLNGVYGYYLDSKI